MKTPITFTLGVLVGGLAMAGGFLAAWNFAGRPSVEAVAAIEPSWEHPPEKDAHRELMRPTESAEGKPTASLFRESLLQGVFRAEMQAHNEKLATPLDQFLSEQERRAAVDEMMSQRQQTLEDLRKELLLFGSLYWQHQLSQRLLEQLNAIGESGERGGNR